MYGYGKVTRNFSLDLSAGASNSKVFSSAPSSGSPTRFREVYRGTQWIVPPCRGRREQTLCGCHDRTLFTFSSKIPESAKFGTKLKMKLKRRKKKKNKKGGGFVLLPPFLLPLSLSPSLLLSFCPRAVTMDHAGFREVAVPMQLLAQRLKKAGMTYKDLFDKLKVTAPPAGLLLNAAPCG